MSGSGGRAGNFRELPKRPEKRRKVHFLVGNAIEAKTLAAMRGIRFGVTAISGLRALSRHSPFASLKRQGRVRAMSLQRMSLRLS